MIKAFSRKAYQTAWQRLTYLYRMTNDVVGACGAFLKAAETHAPPLHQISDMANWLNKEREIIESMEVMDRWAVFDPMAQLMEVHLVEASATDLSRLAWLHLHAGREKRARDIALLGLERDPTNIFCLRLVEKLDS
jgi:hypothetical protein